MKIQLFEEYGGATTNARLFMILLVHREIRIILVGKNFNDAKII